MIMPKYHLHHIEFYLTNVCNLTCTDCRSFNNFNLTGYYDFDIDLYRPWAELLDLDGIEILGGEPTLHPNLSAWMAGLRELWPTTPIYISTNGTYLDKAKNLHELAEQYNVDIKVAMHSQHLRKIIANKILTGFGDCRVLPLEKAPSGDFINTVVLETNRGVKLYCNNYEHFQLSAFKNNEFEFYNSDPVVAHKNCGLSNCHHMIDGKLYKCAVTATAGIFLQQYNLPIPKILSEYRPLTPADITSQQVLDNLQKHIPQCTLCPENNVVSKITSTLKNKKIFKIQNQL
jgi:organic radical activating enzyme